MILDAEFKEVDHTLDADFGEVYNIGDNAYDTGYDEGYEDGKNSVIDLARYAKSFQFATTEGLPEDFTINLENAQTLSNFWYGVSNETVKHITINIPNKITDMTYCFNRSSNKLTEVLERITLNVDTSSVKGWAQAFYQMPNLRIIDGEKPLDFSSSTTLGWSWLSTTNIEEIRIVENTIPISLTASGTKLSIESLLSFLHGLYDYAPNLFDISKIPDIEGKLVNNGDGSLEFTLGVAETVTPNITIRELCPELVVGDVVNVSYACSTSRTSMHFGGIHLNYPSEDGGTATTEITITEDVLNGKFSFLIDENPATVSNIKVSKTPTTTYTLTLGSTNLAKLTDEQKAIATQKGWSLA